MKQIECFAGPMDGTVIDFEKGAVGAIIVHHRSGQPEKCFYRLVKPKRGSAYLHHCDEYGRIANARRC